MIKSPVLELLKSETENSIGTLAFMAMVAGLTQTISILIVNTAVVKFVEESYVDTRLFFLFILVMVLVIYAQTYVLKQTIELIEGAMARTRVRITNKIRQAELASIEGKNQGDIYLNLTQDGNLISASSMFLALAIQSSFIVLFCFIYIAWLSPVAFVVLISLMVLFLWFYYVQDRSIQEHMDRASEQEASFFGLLNHMLLGFKEIKLNNAKNDGLFNHVQQVSQEAKQSKITVGKKFVLEFFATILMEACLLTAVVFILPSFNEGHGTIIISITAVVLFLSGHLYMMLGALPIFSWVNARAAKILRLERELDQTYRPVEKMAPREVEKLYDFRMIDFIDMEYVYRDEEGYPLFPFGPVTLSIKREEILFIVGENGSGKTTLLKLLSGLYFPHKGKIRVDGEVIPIQAYGPYRNLFATVFSDFHLFDKLYGLDAVEDRQVEDWLKRMQLEKKTSCWNQVFSTLTLSTGQRKRLAFIAALLENRPIYIFDELASDQDPEFRRVFYEEVLPDLKRKGKTILAVSHDDRFWHVADRVVKFEYGKQVEEIKARSG